MNFNFALRIAALVLFVIAAIVAFSNSTWDWEGLVATGLACWVGSTVAPARVP